MEKDEFGRPIPGTGGECWQDVCKCRCDDNTTKEFTARRMSSLWQSQPVGNHTATGKNLSRSGCYLVVVISKRSVKTYAMTYFCNHFRSYSWVSAMTFLQTSISSRLNLSSL